MSNPASINHSPNSARITLPTQPCADVHFRMAENAILTRLAVGTTGEGHNVFGVFSKKELIVEPGHVTTFHPGHVTWPTTVVMVVDQGDDMMDVRTEGYIKMGGILIRDEEQLEIRLRCLHRRRPIKIPPMYLLARVGFFPLHPVAGTIYSRSERETTQIKGFLQENVWDEVRKDDADRRRKREAARREEWPKPGERKTGERGDRGDRSGRGDRDRRRKPDPSSAKQTNLPLLDLSEEDFLSDWTTEIQFMDQGEDVEPKEVVAKDVPAVGAAAEERTKVVIERHYYYGVPPQGVGAPEAATEVVAQIVLPELEGTTEEKPATQPADSSRQGESDSSTRTSEGSGSERPAAESADDAGRLLWTAVADAGRRRRRDDDEKRARKRGSQEPSVRSKH